MGTIVKAHAPSELHDLNPLFDAEAIIFLFLKGYIILPETDSVINHNKLKIYV